MKRWILMNPGPVNVTKRVRQSLLKPDICHREIEFSDVLKNARLKLVKIFRVEKTHRAAILTGSGTAAVESMLSSHAEAEKTTLVLSNGVYGERMSKILALHRRPFETLESEVGKFPSLEIIEEKLQSNSDIRSIAMVHHETSSGMLNPLSDIIRLAKKFNKTLLVDAVSSIGAQKVDVKNIDYVAGSSGKCLHGYPGLSFVLVHNNEWLKKERPSPESLYLDLWNTLSLEEKNDTPFTPAVQLFYAFEEALNELLDQGLNKRIQSYAQKNKLLEKGLAKAGLQFVIEKKFRSQVLTSVWLPQNLNYEKLHDELKMKGFVIYAGQSRLAGKIFRVSNLGEMTNSDIHRFLITLNKILKKI